MSPNKKEGEPILITGGAGFIGHHVVEHFLKNTDFTIVILDSLNYAGNLKRLADIDIWTKERYRVKFIWHDLRAEISQSVANMIGQVDYILHLAAETSVDKSLRDPRPFVYSNVVGTMNMLEFARNYQKNLKKYIQISTDEVYGPAPEGVNYKEWDRLKPSNPYSATKAGADCLAFSYAHSFKMPIIITRTMNNFGERQDAEKFIPKTIRSLLQGKKIVIHGTPQNIGSRYWLHARNHADALLFLSTYGENGEIYNVVGNVELNNLEMARLIAKFMGKGLDVEKDIEFVDFHKSRPGHDRRYALDGTKIKQVGWFPPVAFEKSLEKTVKWTLEHPQWLNL
jgi:dTDP-glucose 4,6-dehydratase